MTQRLYWAFGLPGQAFDWIFQSKTTSSNGICRICLQISVAHMWSLLRLGSRQWWSVNAFTEPTAKGGQKYDQWGPRAVACLENMCRVAPLGVSSLSHLRMIPWVWQTSFLRSINTPLLSGSRCLGKFARQHSDPSASDFLCDPVD
jgi:hypothetical protein